MPSLPEQTARHIEAGMRAHQEGRFEFARACYQSALALQPRNPRASALLGVVNLQLGEVAAALQLLELAARNLRNEAWVFGHLAQAYFTASRYAEAQDAFRRAARIDPAQVQYQLGSANALAMQGKFAKAEVLLSRLTERHPNHALNWYNYGNVLRDQGKYESACLAYEKALLLEPGLADAHNNLGSALHSRYQFADAERKYRACLALVPEHIAAQLNLASVLIDVGKFAEGEALCREVIARAPDMVTAHSFLGAALDHQGKLREGIKSHRIAAELNPEDAHLLENVGASLASLGEVDAACAMFERALAISPEPGAIFRARGTALLLSGRIEDGWQDYAHRSLVEKIARKHPELKFSRELPADPRDTTITLLREQGLGDELYFLRYARELGQCGAHVIYYTDEKLRGLLNRAQGIGEVAAKGTWPKSSDFVMLIGDLPNALAGAASSSSQYRYTRYPEPVALRAREEGLARVQAKLAEHGPPPYVALTWRAGVAPQDQGVGRAAAFFKTAPLHALAAMFRTLPGTIVIVQRNPAAGEIDLLSAAMGKTVADFSALNEDLDEMLALMTLVDEYVSVSNTNVHIRAGTGKNARVLVPSPPEWRWALAGDSSPWYPNFSVYRESENGDWDSALTALGNDLRRALING